MKQLLTFGLLCCAFALRAQIPDGYYSAAEGQKGAALKTALHAIIHDHAVESYAALWDDFTSTDCRADGKVWDMYSSVTDFTFISEQCGNYRAEGDCYNREHSFPKSWFGDASPMYTDLFHIYPTDGYVNNRRSNYPFGETAQPAYSSSGGFSRVGPSSLSGYSGTVFEPADEYKGDLARTYFYMATCYEDRIASWNSDMLNGTSYPCFSPWAVDMLLRWAAQDPVSEKETARNDAVYEIQHNRNPFIDFPGLEQYVWGDKTDEAFVADGYEPGGSGGGEEEGGDDTPPAPGTDEGIQRFRKVASTSDLRTGGRYLLVCESQSVAMGAASADVRSYSEVTIADGLILSEVDSPGLPYQLTLGGTDGAYTLFDAASDVYLALESNANKLHGSESAETANALWDIALSDGEVLLANQAYPDRFIRYNASAPRFACYRSAQEAVTLYVNAPTATALPAIRDGQGERVDVYSLDGRLVRAGVAVDEALDGLCKGVYVVRGRKVLLK